MPPSHHICLEVEDIQASAAHAARSARLLDPQPKPGAHGTPVVFLHPKVRWAVRRAVKGGCKGEKERVVRFHELFALWLIAQPVSSESPTREALVVAPPWAIPTPVSTPPPPLPPRRTCVACSPSWRR